MAVDDESLPSRRDCGTTPTVGTEVGYLLEYFSKHTRLANVLVPVLREGNLFPKNQPREPAIRQMHAQFFEQTVLAGEP